MAHLQSGRLRPHGEQFLHIFEAVVLFSAVFFFKIPFAIFFSFFFSLFELSRCFTARVKMCVDECSESLPVSPVSLELRRGALSIRLSGSGS